MIRKIDKFPLTSILIACTGLFFLNLDSLQVTIMEARNFIVAREMITEGNWLFTTMNGLPRYEKPPLPAWLTLPFISTLGYENIVAYRLPTSLASTLGIFIMYFFVSDSTKDRKLALMSSLILATSFYYIAIRFEAPSDIYTHVFMFGGIYFLYKYFAAGKINLLFLVLSGFSTGLSILSKGPVGPYTLLLPFLPAFFFTHRFPDITKKLHYIYLFIITFLAIGGSWYLYLRLADPESFLGMATKETGNWTSYNVKPFYYYWSFFIQSGLWTIPALISLFYPVFKSKVKHQNIYKLSWLWTLTALVLLSFIPEKKSRYLVPVLIPLAITTAIYLNYIIENFHLFKTLKEKLIPCIIFFIYGITGLVYPLSIIIIKPENPVTWIWYLGSSVLFVSAGIMILWNIKLKNLNNAFLLTVLLCILTTSLGMKAVAFINQNKSYRPISGFVNSQELPVYYYNSIQPETIWEIGEITHALNIDLLNNYPNKFYIAAETDKVSSLRDHLKKTSFNIEKEEVYDRNFITAAGSKSPKNRYIVHLLLISR